MKVEPGRVGFIVSESRVMEGRIHSKSLFREGRVYNK